jgi:ABC-type molybdate transport system permease subunit
MTKHAVTPRHHRHLAAAAVLALASALGFGAVLTTSGLVEEGSAR